MAHTVIRAATPAVVSHRMSDLLQSFPAAASGGVQWRTLLRKYEERYSTRLDVAALGCESPLVAATTLLWDVLRLVDREDTDNPVVAIEDAIALTPRPGSLATWPSLYKVLCEIALNHGSLDVAGDGRKASRSILMSQLKPLLQRHWHTNFDDCGLSYLTEEGQCVKLKKMKHLVQAVLRWGEQRRTWRAEARMQHSEVDEVLKPRLELVPSSKHNDLILNCSVDDDMAVPVAHPRPSVSTWQSQSTDVGSTDEASDVESNTSGVSAELNRERELLLAENAMLRSRNQLLAKELLDPVPKPSPEQLSPDLFDDPFEPPPQLSWGRDLSPCSTATTSHPSSGCATPLSRTSSCSLAHSGIATPNHVVAGVPMTVSPTAPSTLCTFMPVLFSMGDRVLIPCGVVQQARAIFERGSGGACAPPNFNIQQ
mmetsp:Transcript_97830/g.169425  ORF Transcript_97830/g.169425 Transcript_97830/m.169425 type:complete len:426 (+) Transcript_97830:114-1391(+)